MSGQPAGGPGLPRWRELPLAEDGRVRSAWGVFGEGESMGKLSLQTPERVQRAAGLVRRGAVFPLDAALDALSPPLARSRGVPRHTFFRLRRGGFDDVYDNFYPQASSQWDSLAHVGSGPDTFYNGASADDIVSGGRNTIDHWARRGIAGRAVLLDLERARARDGRAYDPGSATAFGPGDLNLALKMTGTEVGPGDILLLHTGFLAWYLRQPSATREQLPYNLRAPGVDHTEEVAEWLWDSGAAAIASDTFAVEVWPPGGEEAGSFAFMHRVLIGQLGLALGELWMLGDLAADCARDGVYDSFLTSTPMHAVGGIGSPANALALK